MSEVQLRDRIIHEATLLFARVGYARTSVREIVDAAGATKPTLYYYFGSKAGLFRATLEHHLGGWHQEGARIIAAGGPVLDRLREWLTVSLKAACDKPELMMLVVRAHLDASDGAPEIDFAGYRDRDHQLLCGLIQEGIDSHVLRPHDVDDSICALLGMVHFRILEVLSGEVAREDAAERILAIYLNGVGA